MPLRTLLLCGFAALPLASRAQVRTDQTQNPPPPGQAAPRPPTVAVPP